MEVIAKTEIMDFLTKSAQIINSYGVRKIGVFGSFAKNTQHRNSDIDILVEFYAEKLNYENYINLVFFLEDNLDRKIDVITSDSLSPYIGPQILQEVEYASL